MRQLLLLAVLFFCKSIAFGQSDFPEEWKIKFPININSWRISDDRAYVFGYNDKEGAVISGTEGKLLWSASYADITGLKKIDFQYWVPESGVITLYTNERSTKVCQKYFLDINTGKLLWKTEEGGTSNDFATSVELAQYSPGYITLKNGTDYKRVDIRTGEKASEYKGQAEATSKKSKRNKKQTNYTTYQDDNVYIELKYERSQDAGFMSSRKNRPITVTCYDRKSNSKKWEQVVQGFYLHSLCNTGLFDWTSSDLFGGDHMWLKVEDNRVMVIFDGLAVLDLETGKLLWQTDLKLSDMDFKLIALDQQIGVASLPVVDLKNRRVYVFDLLHDQAIKCYDLDNGNIIWKSESFSKESVIPNLIVYNDLLIAKSGGKIHTQRYVPGTNGNPDVCNQSIKEAGNNGIMVYNASTGAPVWKSEDKAKEWDEKFKSTISDILLNDGKMYVASDDNVMIIEPGTGKLIGSYPMKSLKVGDLLSLNLYDNSLFLKGKEGLAKLSLTDLKPAWTANTGDYISDFQIGDAFYVVTKEDKNNGYMEEFLRVDLSDGKLMGKIKDCAFPYFTDDGEYFFMRDKNEIVKFRTRS